MGALLAITIALLTPAFALTLTTPASSAAPDPNPTTAATDASGLVYPITSFLDWTQNPLNNLTNAGLGEYAAEQELEEAQQVVAHNFPNELAQLTDPSQSTGQDAVDFSEQMADQLVHLRPQVLGDDATDQANPDFLPDFNHNGVSGDPGDFVDLTANKAASGYFLYPCLSDTGAVTYETTTGACAAAGTPGDTYKEGVAQREAIVNSRGLTLSATLWLPARALKAGCPTASADPSPCIAPQGLAPKSSLDGGKGLPAVVISDGLASDQDSYFWLSMTLARAGYIVLTYDPAGQGGSEGSVANLFTPSVANCTFAGACRDLEDVTRWLVGDPITPVVNLKTTTPLVASGPESTHPPVSAAALPSAPIQSPAYAPSGANQMDPALGAINTNDLAIAGHSMGALSLLNYLWFQGHGGNGADGQTLPRINAGVALSGAGATTADVPIQFQTSDFDGSPTLVGPTIGGIDLGAGDSGIGYNDMKPLYDQLRASGPGTATLSMIVLQGGVHTDFIDTPFITRTLWSLAVSAHYAQNWFGCFLDHSTSDCFTAIEPVPHLSSSFASEATPAGPLPRVGRCMTVPTTASLNDPPKELLPALAGHPSSNCS
jgi:pimeloyl-ACP methyl ester carboxylesterase